MENRIKKSNYLQLQCCLALLACTLLPDFGDMLSSAVGSALGAPSILTSDFDFIVFICQIAAIVGAGIALKAFYDADKQLQTPMAVMNGGGLAIAIVSMIPSVPDWLQYIALVLLLGALFTNKKNLGVQLSSQAGIAAYMILISMILTTYNDIDDTMMTSVAALVGFIMYLMGLGKLGASVDKEGQLGVSKLKIAVILGVCGVIISIIPLIGGIIGGIFGIVAFIFGYIGYGNLMKCATIGAMGNAGASKVRMSMIVSVIAAIVDFFPMTGIIVSLLALLALWLIYSGWTMIYKGIECGDEIVVNA
ncbi:MAG: hypothetical protein J6C78_02455 [Muribaculaceae bacterium]|nr:hypothetical protein [Muribaculaceae bacterium]